MPDLWGNNLILKKRFALLGRFHYIGAPLIFIPFQPLQLVWPDLAEMLLKGWPRILELTGRYEGEISLQANCSICLLFFRGRCLNVLVKSCKTAL